MLVVVVEVKGISGVLIGKLVSDGIIEGWFRGNEFLG